MHRSQANIPDPGPTGLETGVLVPTSRDFSRPEVQPCVGMRKIKMLMMLVAIGGSGIISAGSLPQITILATNPITSEGDPVNPARITLVRTGHTDSSLAVNIQIGGTATTGSDYLPIPSPITLPAGQSSHEIVIFPYKGDLAEGLETITFTVEPGTGYTVASPDLASVTILDTQYDVWKHLKFTTPQQQDPDFSGPAANPDGDSTSNLGEFFANSDPLNFDIGPVAEIGETGGQFQFTLRRNPAAFALAVRIEESSVLSGWQPLDPQPPMELDVQDGWDLPSFAIPASTGTRRFFRARISPPPAEVYNYYVDADLGNDSNTGISPTTAFGTISKALAATAGNRSASIGLARGQRHVPAASMTYGIRGRWGAYGEGHLPFIDCSVAVNTGDIVPHGTHPNVYVVEITHEVAPFFTNNINSNGPHVGLWWETAETGIVGSYLTPVFGSSDAATAEQFVRDNPGRCFVQKVGSTLTDVRLETSGNTLRYTFQLADSSDPRAGGHLRYACHHAANLTFNPGAEISDIAFGRNTRKDLTNCAATAATPEIALPLFLRCVWLDPGCHANVSPSNWKKCIAYSRTRSRINGGGAWHNYTNVFEPRVSVCEDSFISGFTQGCYSHGSGQNPVLQSMQACRLRIEDCLSCFTSPSCAVVPEFADIKATNVRYLLSGIGNLSRFAAFMPLNSDGRRAIYQTFPPYSLGKVENGIINFVSSGSAYITDYAPSRANAEALGTPTLRNVTITPGTESASVSVETQRYIDYIFENVAGLRTVFTNDMNSTFLLSNATITNSYVGPIRNGSLPLFNTLAEYQAKVPGVANDVIMFNGTKPVTFAGDPLVDPTITGPTEILARGTGVDPRVIFNLSSRLTNVPTLQSTGLNR